jgi:uncharacterized membrane protein
MLVWFHRLRRFHHFLAHQALYPLVFSSLLAVGLFAGRVYLALSSAQPYTSHPLMYINLVWNLFLAWVPYLASLWAAGLYQRHPRRWPNLLIPGAVWLVFFPNAPYIVTDFMYLEVRPPIPIWYDVVLLSVFAWTGLFLAIFSLRTMQTLVRSFLGSLASWLFVLGSLGLGGLGIYMGRYLRWNSWDLFFQPRDVLADVAVQLANPWDYPRMLGVTLIFAAFLLVCYLTLAAVPWRRQS